MRNEGIELQGVSFAYEDAGRPLLQGITCRFAAGWTGVVGPNGSGKTTLLKLATGLLEPVSGRIIRAGKAVYCEQRTDDAPPMFADLVRAADRAACEIRGRLRIETEWLERWQVLSHGERKRCQVGVALWHDPEVLAVDEPANHLDMDARRLLAGALASFRGIGVIVSHDRDLLDGLCGRCLFLDPPDAVMRPGGYTAGAREAERERRALLRARRVAGSTRRKLEQEIAKRRREAARADRRRSKHDLDPGDRDGREKAGRARNTGKDAIAGKLSRQLEGRLRQARGRQERLQVRKAHPTGIRMPGGRSQRDALFRVDGGELALGGGRALRLPELVMRPDDRIALTGPNGAGKSTFVREIVGSLGLPEKRAAYVPQEIDRADARLILERARGLPRNILGTTMNVVSRLGSRPQRLLESRQPSPGEVRKLLLAVGIAQEPHLIIMDEPTNHMDLVSIECLEDALDECPCALLLVSHDRRFLKRLTEKRWHIDRDDAARDSFALHEIQWDE
jgi:ATPase subunit of ABC transporter with duplicated ATPase domains